MNRETGRQTERFRKADIQMNSETGRQTER